MPHDAQHALRQYLVLASFAGVCFLISWLLSADPTFLLVIKTVFAPVYLLAITSLDAHFRRADGAPWPFWQKAEYAVARAALLLAFIVVMCLGPDQTAADMARPVLTIALAIGSVEVFFALRNRASAGR